MIKVEFARLKKGARAFCVWMFVGLILSGDLLAGETKFPLLDAAQVAQQDFVSRLQEFPAETEYDRYVENIDNYAIGLSDGGDIFLVVFQLMPETKGEVIKGGGALYKIRKADLVILEFSGQE